ncbi:MAG: hypothetical protein ACK5NY_04930 [Burkholderiaceae bacterium]|jgi:hypothetical protein
MPAAQKALDLLNRRFGPSDTLADMLASADIAIIDDLIVLHRAKIIDLQRVTLQNESPMNAIAAYCMHLADGSFDKTKAEAIIERLRAAHVSIDGNRHSVKTPLMVALEKDPSPFAANSLTRTLLHSGANPFKAGPHRASAFNAAFAAANGGGFIQACVDVHGRQALRHTVKNLYKGLLALGGGGEQFMLARAERAQKTRVALTEDDVFRAAVFGTLTRDDVKPLPSLERICATDPNAKQASLNFLLTESVKAGAVQCTQQMLNIASTKDKQFAIDHFERLFRWAFHRKNEAVLTDMLVKFVMKNEDTYLSKTRRELAKLELLPPVPFGENARGVLQQHKVKAVLASVPCLPILGPLDVCVFGATGVIAFGPAMLLEDQGWRNARSKILANLEKPSSA